MTQPKRLAFAAVPTIKAESADGATPGTIEILGYTGGELSINYWDAPVVCELSGIHAVSELLPIRICHGHDDLDDVLGQATVTIDDKQVTASGRITGASQRAALVIAMAKKGHQFQASIGASPTRHEFVDAGVKIELNGRTFTGPLYAVHECDLTEISVVSLGADTNTTAKIAAKAARSTVMAKMEFSEWCKAKGFDAATADDTQKEFLSNCYAAEKDPEAETETKKDEEEKAEAARRKATIEAAHREAMKDPMVLRAQQYERMAAIEAKSAGHADIAALALKGNWDDTRIANEIELKTLRAGRASNQAPAGHIAGKGVDMGRALEASWMRSGGVTPDRLVAQYGEPNVLFAQRKLSGLGLRDTLRAMAALTGHSLPAGNGTDFVEALVHLVASSRTSSIEADGGGSPVSLPGILSNVAHKLLLESYNRVEQTWRVISKQGSLQDFKPHNRFRLTNDMKFKPLNANGELQHGKLGEQAYIIQGDTEGIMFNLDRKLIINDDMSAFAEIPKTVGRGAGLAINEAFWTLWLSNPTIGTAFKTDGTDGLQTGSNAFFSTGNSNYLAGVTVGTNDSRLNVEGLSRAYTSQLKQTDPAGYPMGEEPTILLVPASLRYTAESLMLSRILVSSVSTGATNNNLQPSENPLAGKFQVAASAYLDNASFTGNSATGWYLLLDPNGGFDCIEAAFLNGMQTPVVERAEANFENLGIRFRSWIDFGLALKEFRGGTFNKGAA